MAFTIVTTQTVLARTAGALFGLELGSTYMNSLSAAAGSTTASQTAFLNTLYANSVGASTANSVVVSAVMTNLGIPTTDAATYNGVSAYLQGQLDAAQYTARGGVLNDFLTLFSTLTASPYVVAYNTKIANAEAYAAISTNTGNASFGDVTTSPAPATFTLTTGADLGAAFTGGAGDDAFNATQTTFNLNDVLNGGSGTDTLSITDTGTAAWTLPSASVTGIENINIRNANGSGATAAVTETANLTFQNVVVGETIIINGLTMTATTGTASATDIAAAFASGVTVGNAVITGTAGATWTVAANGANGVTFTSTTAGTNVTDLTVTGTAQTGVAATPQASNLVITHSTEAIGDVITFTYNGVTVTTAALVAATAADASAKIAAAINAYAGSTIADGTTTGGTVSITSPAAVSLAGFTLNNAHVFGATTYTLTTPFVAAKAASPATLAITQGAAQGAGAGFTDTVAAGNFTGATTFTANNSTSAVNFTGLAASQNVVISGAAQNAAVGVGYANTVTAGTINIAGGVTGGAITETGTGILSNTINSTGAKNTVGAITLSGTADTALTINAATALVTGGITGFTGTTSTITVAGAATNTAPSSTSAGNAAVVLGTIEAATVGAINASGLTAGGINAALNANTSISVTGGAGNDIITTGSALVSGSVAAGAGTGDTLILSANAHINTVALGAKYTGFEIVSIGTGGTTLDLDQLSPSNTLTGLIITGSTAGAGVTNINAATAANVNVTASTTMTLGVKNALNPGQIDTVNLLVDDHAAAVGTITITAPNLAGVEILGIVATDNATVTSLANAAALTNINVSGAAAVSITTTAMALQTNFNVNAGTLTGNFTFNATGETTNGFGITGGSGINTITGGNQIFTANLAASTAKADVITLTNATGGTLALANAAISGFTSSATVSVGDHLELAGVAIVGRAGAAVAAAATSTVATMTGALSTTGIMTFGGTGAATATLADKINASLEAAYVGGTNLQTVAFEHGGNTYVVESDGTAGFNAASDYVVQLTGVTGITGLSTTASGAGVLWVS